MAAEPLLVSSAPFSLLGWGTSPRALTASLRTRAPCTQAGSIQALLLGQGKAKKARLAAGGTQENVVAAGGGRGSKHLGGQPESGRVAPSTGSAPAKGKAAKGKASKGKSAKGKRPDGAATAPKAKRAASGQEPCDLLAKQKGEAPAGMPTGKKEEEGRRAFPQKNPTMDDGAAAAGMPAESAGPADAAHVVQRPKRRRMQPPVRRRAQPSPNPVTRANPCRPQPPPLPPQKNAVPSTCALVTARGGMLSAGF